MTEKNLGGRPEYKPLEQHKPKIIAFVCAGYTNEQIADYFDIDVKTLKKYYRYELDQAKMEKISALSKNAYKMALQGNERMMEFVLKCQGRWCFAKPPEEDKKSDATALLESILSGKIKVNNAE